LVLRLRGDGVNVGRIKHKNRSYCPVFHTSVGCRSRRRSLSCALWVQFELQGYNPLSLSLTSILADFLEGGNFLFRSRNTCDGMPKILPCCHGMTPYFVNRGKTRNLFVVLVCSGLKTRHRPDQLSRLEPQSGRRIWDKNDRSSN
jgi:hypothetical protein